MDERGNILLELQVLDKEIRTIFTVADKLTIDIAKGIAEDSTARTGSPLLDARMRLTGNSVVSAESLNTIEHLLLTAEKTSDAFKDATRQIVIMNKKLMKVIDLDNEIIATLSEVIEYLKANNVEDTVIKNTLIKKSMRVFIGNEGSGRSVIPYVCSKLKSRENANVLYIDITGNNKVSNYGETMLTLDDWMTNRQQQHFCGVQGKLPNTYEAAQRFMTALTKAADYYKVINPEDVPARMLSVGEFSRLSDEIMAFNDFDTPEGIEEEVKN
jgi:hypothetical protein